MSLAPAAIVPKLPALTWTNDGGVITISARGATPTYTTGAGYPNACAYPDKLKERPAALSCTLAGMFALPYCTVSAASPSTKTHAVPLPSLLESSMKPPHGSKSFGIGGAACGVGLTTGAGLTPGVGAGATSAKATLSVDKHIANEAIRSGLVFLNTEASFAL